MVRLQSSLQQRSVSGYGGIFSQSESKIRRQRTRSDCGLHCSQEASADTVTSFHCRNPKMRTENKVRLQGLRERVCEYGGIFSQQESKMRRQRTRSDCSLHCSQAASVDTVVSFHSRNPKMRRQRTRSDCRVGANVSVNRVASFHSRGPR